MIILTWSILLRAALCATAKTENPPHKASGLILAEAAAGDPLTIPELG